MRIAINLIGFFPKSGGVETYVLNLLDALQRVDRENDYLVLCDEPAASSLNIFAENFHLRVFAYHKFSCKGMLRGVVQRLFGVDILAHELASLPVDVMHHPLTVLNPPGLPFPAVLTFHDMQQEFLPQFFSPGELRRRHHTYPPSVKEAAVVVAVSAHTGQSLVDRYGITPHKIRVIPSGCSCIFHPRKPEELAAIALELAIDRPFMIYPAALWPHKNHLRLLEALHQLVTRSDFDGELLLTGADVGGRQKLAAEIDRLGLSSRVRWLGYLPPNHIPCLLNLARLLIFPSLFEGFGLPVVEAMASGCPVVCSHNTSLPEVGGDAVLYFDPDRADDIAQTVARIWNDESLQQQLRQRGLERAKLFCWEETAYKTLEVYRHLASPQ